MKITIIEDIQVHSDLLISCIKNWSGEKLSEVDLSLIIGNLMDNAMEAFMKIEEPEKWFIRVYIDILKGHLYIYVMNSVNEKLKRSGKTYVCSVRRANCCT